MAIFGASFIVRNAATHAASVNPYQVGIGALKNATPQFTSLGPKSKAGMHNPTGTCVAGLDSVANFCGSYTVAGLDPSGHPNSSWQWQMLGSAPQHTGPGTTTFNAPIIPVTVQLLNPDGSVLYTYSPSQYVNPVLNSPVFSDTKYSSGPKPTQLPDAEQRAEFYNQAKNSWHTMLNPQVTPGLTMQIPSGYYFYALNPDGTCCQFVLADYNEFGNLLFPSAYPFDNSTVVGAAENLGYMTTKDVTTLLFPNTYLYLNGNINDCCVLGYHTFDYEPGIPSNGNLPRAYVVNYSSWISPGLFSGGFQDVTALSHEMAESFNDPFVTAFNNLDITPWWSSGGNCQDNLEVGDVVEGLSNPTYPITMNGMTYHPQTIALLQWFESNGTSNAIDGAFSYPNESVLTTSNVSQNVTFDKFGNPTCTGPLT